MSYYVVKTSSGVDKITSSARKVTTSFSRISGTFYRRCENVLFTLSDYVVTTSSGVDKITSSARKVTTFYQRKLHVLKTLWGRFRASWVVPFVRPVSYVKNWSHRMQQFKQWIMKWLISLSIVWTAFDVTKIRRLWNIGLFNFQASYIYKTTRAMICLVQINHLYCYLQPFIALSNFQTTGPWI